MYPIKIETVVVDVEALLVVLSIPVQKGMLKNRNEFSRRVRWG